MKQRYSLYEIIKPKLSPRTQKKLEDQMKYNQLIRRSIGDEKNL